MRSRSARIDTGVSVSFIASAVIHVTVFLLLVWSGRLLPPKMPIQDTYYVDVVSMPVAAPQQGGSNPSPAGAPAPPAPAPQMALPVKQAVKGPAKNVKQNTRQETAETESAFAERIAGLQRKSEARREEAVLEKLRSKVKSGSAKQGAPGTVGVESGVRYADFIKSRLEDALKITSSYSTKNPEVAVKLTISGEGRLSRMKIEHSSGDATFELAVRRAIDLASEKFTAPPGRTPFENGFVFKPKGISSGAAR